MLIVLSCILIVPVLWIFVWWIKYVENEKILKHFPGPRPWPLLGNALEFRSHVELLPAMMGFCRKYNEAYKIYVGSRPYLFIWKPADVKVILNSTTNLKKSYDYRLTNEWLGNGLLTATGERWMKHRKMITPCFHYQILEEFLDTFNDSSNILISKLNEGVGKPSVDLYYHIGLCTLDIICETAMGTSIHAQDNADSPFVKSLHRMMEIIMLRAYSPIHSFDILHKLSKLRTEELGALKVLNNYTNSVIHAKRMELLKKKQRGKIDFEDDSRKKKKALLEVLLESVVDGQPLTDEQIREEVNTFMFEGHDTTCASITFCLYCLAKYPYAQTKVYEEIKAIFSDDPSRPLTFGDIAKMNYLDLVIKESLRFYTTAPFIGRELTEEVVLNGRTLPKGLQVNILIAGAHADPELHPNPEIFDPERFAAAEKNKDSFAYIPFSAGPRNCIGQKYAILEMKAIVSNVVRNFQLLPTVPEHKMILVTAGVLRPLNGVLVQLRRRKDAR